MNILFTPGVDFENLINRAEFNPVASRAAQQATYKAEKAGETTVDLAAAKGGSTSTTPEVPDPDGGSTDTGGNDDGVTEDPLHFE